MGNSIFLQRADTQKDSAEGEGKDGRFKYGVSAMQGWRRAMEDAHVHMPDFDEAKKLGLFCIFDGHGGQAVATLCAKHLPNMIREQPEYEKGDYERALIEAFKAMDRYLDSPEGRAEVNELGRASKGAEKKEEGGNSGMSLREKLLKYNLDLGQLDESDDEEEEDDEEAVDGNDDLFQPDINEGPSELEIYSRKNQILDEDSSSPTKPLVGNGPAMSSSADFAEKLKNVEKVDDDVQTDSREENISTTTTDSTATSEDNRDENGLESSETAQNLLEQLQSKNSVDIEQEAEVMKVSETLPTLPRGPSDALDDLFNAEIVTNQKDDGLDSDEESFDPNDIEIGAEDDEEIRSLLNASASYEPETIGCTANVVLIEGGEIPKIYCANAGDSRAVLCRSGKQVPLSFDHKPTDAEEHTRIYKAGGFVNDEGRVDGNLNLSRALGDLFYKKNKELKEHEQKISGVPDVKVELLQEEDEYIVIGCDGIWEKFDNEQMIDYVNEKKRDSGLGFSRVCEEFLDQNVAPNPGAEQGLGCDNMSMMIVIPHMTSQMQKRRRSEDTPESEEERLAKKNRTEDDRLCVT